MDVSSKAIISSLNEQSFLMIEQLHQLCAINSGTENLLGLSEVLQILTDAFTPIADTISTLIAPPISNMNMAGELSMQLCGPSLFIRKRSELQRRILLVGHMDTVYPENSSFNKLTYLNDNHLQGPGVADMKGGLVVLLHALTAFENSLDPCSLGWDVLINADEEIGSPASGVFIEEIAKNYQAALVYEPAMCINGTFAKNRKGAAKITIVATGIAAHAGRAFDEGRNAICYLAEVILAIDALNGKRKGVTLNIGKILGGSALNIVPEKAVVKLDIRMGEKDDSSWVLEQIHTIIKLFKRKDYSLKIHSRFDRPVKQINKGTKRLFKKIQTLGQELNLPIRWQDSGGCCDGNNLAHQGLAVIDTMGVRGGFIHSPDEFILLDSLVERASLSANLFIDLAQGGLEELSS